MNVLCKKLAHFDNNLALPAYETKQAAGADVRVSFADKNQLILKPNERVALPTGLCLEIPSGWEVQVRPRSGLSLKTSLMVLNSPGTIDSDYRGELKVIVGNLGKEHLTIEHGQRVAQLVLSPIHQMNLVLSDQLSVTDRGSAGFGSTGII